MKAARNTLHNKELVLCTKVNLFTYLLHQTCLRSYRVRLPVNFTMEAKSNNDNGCVNTQTAGIFLENVCPASKSLMYCVELKGEIPKKQLPKFYDFFDGDEPPVMITQWYDEQKGNGVDDDDQESEEQDPAWE